MLHSPGCVCHRISIEKKGKRRYRGHQSLYFQHGLGLWAANFTARKKRRDQRAKCGIRSEPARRWMVGILRPGILHPAPLGHGRQRQTAERKLPNLKHVASRTRSASPRVGPAASPRCKLRRDPGTDKTVACTKDHTIKSF